PGPQAGEVRGFRHGAPQQDGQRANRARRKVAGAAAPTTFFAGQMSGVEGYVESASSGLLAGLNAAAMVKGEPLSCPPRTTAIGALAYYVSHANPAHYEPSNVTFGIIEALPKPPRGKMEKKLAIAERALRALEDWRARRHDGTA